MLYPDFNTAGQSLDAAIWETSAHGSPLLLKESKLRDANGVLIPNSGDRVPISPANRKEYTRMLEERRAAYTETYAAEIEAAETVLAEEVERQVAAFNAAVEALDGLEARGDATVEEYDETLVKMLKMQRNRAKHTTALRGRLDEWEASAPEREDVEAYAVSQINRLYAAYPALRSRTHPCDFPW